MATSVGLGLIQYMEYKVVHEVEYLHILQWQEWSLSMQVTGMNQFIL